jgi:hypothetical protein
MTTTQITGYHCTSKEAWKIIKAKGLKGSKWVEDMTRATTNPFNLVKDGAVWCYPTLQIARANVDEDEVILKIEGQGQIVDHYAHGICHVGIANHCTATLVRKNQK